jgi:hypothetical protein
MQQLINDLTFDLERNKPLLSDESDELLEFNDQVGKAEDDGSSEEPEARITKSKPRSFSVNDYCSWGVLGNDQFVASGKTASKLPPGVYRLAQNPNGQIVFMKAKMVTDNLFHLADTVSVTIIESIAQFWDSKPNFDKFGMLFKRGILLFGPPGSGKTVCVTLLAQQIMGRGGIVTMCEHPNVASLALQTVRRVEPDRPIVNIMEDIDSIIDNYGDSAILSLLDGENQVPNIVHLATTNYPDRLDPRIVNRPSRFDEIRKVDMPKANIRRAYFASVLSEFKLSDTPFAPLPEGANEELDRWVNESEGFSMAHLRELVIAMRCLQRDYTSTIKRLQTMVKTSPKLKGGKGSGFVQPAGDGD